MKKYRIFAQTWVNGSKVEVEGESDKTDEKDIDKELLDQLFDSGMIEWGYEEIDREDEN